MEEKIINATPAPGEEEIWAECVDYPAYEVSTFGNVRNAATGTLMKPKFTNSGGYAQVHFRIGVESKNEYFAALSLSTPKALATVIVIPDLDVPGNAAAIA